MTKSVRLSALLVAATTLPLLAQSPSPTVSQMMQARHWTGQGVSPVYEGFDINPDGSFNMWFGYMNRNYEEEIDVEVGPDNTFEPGGDRGQPTHFTPRRHKDVFKVVVPKDFGDQKLTWKLTAHLSWAGIFTLKTKPSPCTSPFLSARMRVSRTNVPRR